LLSLLSAAYHQAATLNIDLYRSNTIISLAIYNPAEFNIPEGKKPENNWGAN
jgi:hypothetical protein